MSFSVTMPALGESVSEGTVTRWLKQEGEQVAVDEPLLEVSTDKVDTEIPSPAAGVLQRIVVQEDETVDVGTELAVIGDSAEAGGAAPQQGQPASEDQGGQAQQQAAQQQQAPSQQQQAPQQGGQDSGGQDSGGQASGGSGGGGTPVAMPALGESVTEGTVTRWLKQVGDSVEVDEPLLEVSTDKVDTEIPSPVGGTLLAILVNEDETVAVGTDLATIGDASQASAGAPPASTAPAQAAPPQPAVPQQQSQQAQPSQQQTPAQEQAQQAPADPGRVPTQQPAPSSPARTPAQAQAVDNLSTAPAPRKPDAGGQQAPSSSPQAAVDGEPSLYVTPLVRKLAAEHAVDLSSVTGTGVGGRIRKQDVLEAAEAKKAPPAPQQQATPAAPQRATSGGGVSGAVAAVSPLRGTTVKMSRLRKVIAQRMVESLQVSAQLTTVVEVDVTRIATLRQRAKGEFETREGVKLSFLPFFAKAAVEALKAFPQVNASIEGEDIVYHAQENLGVAVDTDRGLLVPVIKDAGDLNIAGLARRIADLADRTRGNKITPDELGGGTFTLTNTGSRGALFDTPIINQPQVGILGTGAVVKRPMVVSHPDLGETIAVRSMAYLALSYDHRLVDGADAARFLSTIKQRLEEGAFEADLGL